MNNNKKSILALSIGLLLSGSVHAQDSVAELAKRLDELAAENKRLQARVEQLESTRPAAAAATPAAKASAHNAGPTLALDHKFSFDMLDTTTRINRKQEFVLQQKQSDAVAKDAVYFGGAVTAIASYQNSNTPDKFGYLMRHPTSANQRTETVSEAVIHSAQLDVVANLGDFTTAYIEYLYDPEQSFGAGTITALSRNQVQLRQGYVMFGDLESSPFYASIGKMATPFGLMDTPNPFTASTVWHAFGGLAYGVKGGYMKDGWNLRLMGIQGGAQFRGANVPVDNTAIPSKLNNYAADANYTFELGGDDSLLLGSSYTRGSAYCQSFPVTHFSPCTEANAAYDIYAQWKSGNWTTQAEFARTLDLWPGTFNPSIPQHEASKVTSWDLGTKYRSTWGNMAVEWSADISRFISGPDGSPWEKQDQIVLGWAAYATQSTKLFAELIHTSGYAPLNFISGGNLGPGVTHSDRDARSNLLVVGANVAF